MNRDSPFKPEVASKYAKYVKVKTLGKGSYGEVDLVRHKRTGQLYVMKVVPYHPSSSHQHNEALREVEMLRLLKHPNIVQFKEAYIASSGEELCIVMTYCENGDLTAWIKTGKQKGKLLPEKQIMAWFVQIAMALAYLHSNKILHRDIKPHNIFLSGKGRIVKLGDFGVTRILEHTMSMANTTIGTPYYVSPEICKNMPYAYKSDVWALGVLMYELCALRVPFDARDFAGLRKAILTEKPYALSRKYSPSLRKLVGDMLTKNPANRPDVRNLLARPFVQQHLRALVEAHSQSPPKPISSGSADVTAEGSSRPTEEKEKLLQQQEVLEQRVREDEQRLKKIQAMEDLGGAIRVEGKEDGSSGDVEVLKSEVQRNKDALMQTAMRLHDVVKEEESDREIHMMRENAHATLKGSYAEEMGRAEEGEEEDIPAPSDNGELEGGHNTFDHSKEMGSEYTNEGRPQPIAPVKREYGAEYDGPLTPEEKQLSDLGAKIARATYHGQVGGHGFQKPKKPTGELPLPPAPAGSGLHAVRSRPSSSASTKKTPRGDVVVSDARHEGVPPATKASSAADPVQVSPVKPLPVLRQYPSYESAHSQRSAGAPGGALRSYDSLPGVERPSTGSKSSARLPAVNLRGDYISQMSAEGRLKTPELDGPASVGAHIRQMTPSQRFKPAHRRPSAGVKLQPLGNV